MKCTRVLTSLTCTNINKVQMLAIKGSFEYVRLNNCRIGHLTRSDIDQIVNNLMNVNTIIFNCIPSMQCVLDGTIRDLKIQILGCQTSIQGKFNI